MAFTVFWHRGNYNIPFAPPLLRDPLPILCEAQNGEGWEGRYNHFMRKGLLLYNPAAGRVPVRPFVRGIIRPLKEAGWQVEVAEALSGSHATQVARQAAAGKFDAVFAIGGRGTVGQVGRGVMECENARGGLAAPTVE